MICMAPMIPLNSLYSRKFFLERFISGFYNCKEAVGSVRAHCEPFEKPGSAALLRRRDISTTATLINRRAAFQAAARKNPARRSSNQNTKDAF